MRSVILTLVLLLTASSAYAFGEIHPNGGIRDFDSLPSSVRSAIGSEYKNSMFYYEFKFGQDEAAVNGDTIDIEDGVYDFYPTAAVTLDIKGGANDTTGGTGCATARIWGTDANIDQQVETVTLNGATEVDLGNTYTSVFRVRCVTAGSTSAIATVSNATELIIAVDDAACGCGQSDNDVAANVAAGHGQTQMSQYLVPDGYCAAITHGVSSADSSGVEVHVFTNPDVSQQGGGAWNLRDHDMVSSSTVGSWDHAIIVEPLTAIKAVTHRGAGAPIVISYRYSIYLYAKIGSSCTPTMPVL